ncbi:MAG TPA: alpha/beta fold hydrolase [Ornithinibacter sp.]|nr:alpha/beta fold hydrolase [Ornithinibacter sp.]
MTWRRVSLPDAVLAVAVRGSGEPLVLVQTALTADELLPVAQQPVLDGFRVVLYHRRGYAGSTPAQGPGSIERDARDGEQLLAALDISRAHVVGLSSSSAIAMRLAASAPGLVHTLTLIEPPPMHSRGAREFVAERVEQHRTRGTDSARDLLMRRIVGPDWRRDTEQHLPGADHSLARTHPVQVATAIASFLRAHPMGG